MLKKILLKWSEQTCKEVITIRHLYREKLLQSSLLKGGGGGGGQKDIIVIFPWLDFLKPVSSLASNISPGCYTLAFTFTTGKPGMFSQE